LTSIRTNLAKEALEKSLEVREEHGYDFRSPLCVYEFAARARVRVQFVDEVSMEGIYAALAKPTILISALRPLSRRAFTCAHELGHHFFGHGSTIDEIKDEAQEGKFQPNEFLVDTFAGFLLMPAQGVKRAFSSRGIDPARATTEQIYTIASSFGVGYKTLITHLAHSLRYITAAHADELRKSKLPQIRERILSFAAKEPLAIADCWHALGTLDAEVGTLVLLPPGAISESDQIEPLQDTPNGRVFRALRPGLARASVPGENWGIVVRVSRFQYSGLAQYRHLEETDSE
jgi:Zn-dependent peptidase ImmA (M78 family)